LKEKDSLLHSAKGSLAEAHSQNEKLSKELEEARTLLEKNSDRFNRESEALNARIEAEVEKNVKLSETVKILRDKCFGFATQCIARLKDIFNSVGVVSEKVIHSTEDILGAIECVEKEVDVLDEVITGHGDLCALVASSGTTAAFIKAGCNHVRAVNRPNFSLPPSDLVDILAEARSIGNRFITQI
jgi:predicted nuclease with TOPRIM domain